MNQVELGALEQVDVREVWRHEAQDFTPWLAENLDKLSAVLHVDLEREGVEVQVGPYRADIVARIPQDGTRVLIENQLEGANLQHLGQVLAYLAGLDAEIVVWIATGFDEAHLSAIRWLNEHTEDPFAFFAVKLEVVRIGDSQSAAVFDVLERPNQWQRQAQEVGRSGELSEIGRFRREFWAHFASRIPEAPGLRPGYAGSNVWHRIEGADISIVQFLSAGRVGVYLSGRWGESREAAKTRIEPYAVTIREALSDYEMRDSEFGPCYSALKVNLRDRGNWDKIADWLDSRRRSYAQALSG